jgi:hypothetical protein
VPVAAALDPLGRLLGSESFAADLAGYKALLSCRQEGEELVRRLGLSGDGLRVLVGVSERPLERGD